MSSAKGVHRGGGGGGECQICTSGKYGPLIGTRQPGSEALQVRTKYRRAYLFIVSWELETMAGQSFLSSSFTVEAIKPGHLYIVPAALTFPFSNKVFFGTKELWCVDMTGVNGGENYGETTVKSDGRSFGCFTTFFLTRGYEHKLN